MNALKQRRWFNQGLPQTLQIAVFLLYLNGFFGVMNLLGIAFKEFGLGFKLIAAATVVTSVLGGLGISEERRNGYRIAVAAAFLPFAARFVGAVSLMGGLAGYDIGDVIRATVGVDQLINLIFEVALIVLLLHPQSREHERVWFR